MRFCSFNLRLITTLTLVSRFNCRKKIAQSTRDHAKKIYTQAPLKVKLVYSGGNTFVSGAGGLRFKSRASQIGHSVAEL